MSAAALAQRLQRLRALARKSGGLMMMDKQRIAAEAEAFFEWSDPANKNVVTFDSCLIFAEVIARMAVEQERKAYGKQRVDSTTCENYVYHRHIALDAPLARKAKNDTR